MRARLAALTAVVVLLSGCGGAGYVSLTGEEPTASTAATQSVWLQPAESGARWMDVADTLYAGAWRSDCGYSATVAASLADTTKNPLIVTLNADDLKPNFAYQVKLEGLPAQDPWGNAQLGALGRWWGDVGYLVFGYLVTDENGAVLTAASSKWWTNSSVAVDSSYHVLWKTSQRSRQRFDGPAIEHVVSKVSPYYEEPGEGATVRVYGEWESGRPKPGSVSLPAGTYTVLLRLSEECFHNTEPDGGGYTWPSVLDAQVTFTIQASGGKPPRPKSH